MIVVKTSEPKNMIDDDKLLLKDSEGEIKHWLAPKGADSKELARQAREWIASPEGQQALANAMAEAEKAIAQLQPKQEVDPSAWYEVIG